MASARRVTAHEKSCRIMMFIDKALLHLSGLMVAFSLISSCAWASEERPEEPPKGSQVASRQPQLNTVFPMGIQPGQKLRLEIQCESLYGPSQLLVVTTDVSG